ACDRAAKEFNQHTSGLDNATLEKILTHVHNPLRAMLIEKIGFNLPAQLELPLHPKPRKGFRWILKQFLPYGVVMARRHLEKYLSRAS
ncbi:MAG: hypothetical protein NTZ94_13900, partial [Verrucomicrobia bacterium]|nr:hypothetical protein [Verrucomicrobiota bacterium]